MPLTQQHADILWMLIAAALVMLMQGGFCLLESGLARAKNSINVAIKNAVDFCVSMVLFWLVGFGLMFGTSQSGLFGTDLFMLKADSTPWLLAFFLFQVVFCGTATTIISGAIAERARFSGYLAITVIVSGLLYPVFGHWAWGGIVPGTSAGWLSSMGFIDFAGSSVVHSLGGWAALAAAIVIGPRLGRFSEKRPPIVGHNLPMAAIGTLMLWFGWFGFNGGSTLSVDDSVPLIVVNTNLAAAAGGLAVLVVSWVRRRLPDVGELLNGTIAGLVGITACCHVVSPAGALVVGAVAALVCLTGMRLLERMHVDDVIGAVPAHAMAGVWGTLAVALLGQVDKFGTGLDRWDQLGVQAIGVATCFVWSFGLGIVLMTIVNQVLPLRVARRAEREGLNVAEHGASTELVDLLTRMNAHRERGVFTRVAVEPHTEVGQIAAEYNRVLTRVAEEMEHRDEAASAARSAEEKYRGIFENAVEGIYRTTPAGRFDDVNPALVHILGFASREQLLAEVTDIATQVYSDATRRDEFLRLVDSQGTVQDFESMAVRRDGSPITICENARVVRDEEGRVLHYEGTVEDVTQRRLAEELVNEKEAADARDRAKSAFLANMSHEIRTPLNGVVGMLELLGRTTLDERQSRFVRIATSSADALLTLINDILDFSKIEAGKLEVEQIPFDLHLLLEDVAEMFGHQASTKGIELTCFIRPAVPTHVLGDPERLRQIVVNLVSNAIKFTDSGEVRIEVVRERTQPFLRIEVVDEGIGIPEERQRELFTPFTQLDASTTRKYGGTGLGLAICGQLAELMGGAMSVKSTLEVGSTFACSVPLPEAEDLREPKPTNHALSGARVVAVDDNETNREILQEQLTAWGVDVEVYETPRDLILALDATSHGDPSFDLAILDQHMPETSGVQLVEEIRTRPEYRDMSIAILSSVDEVVDRATADRLGIHAVLTKPIRQSRLFDVLVDLFHRGNRHSVTSAPAETKTESRLTGRILVAEDNEVNQLVVREILDEFGVECDVVPNGAEAVERLRKTAHDLVLMDCQMPVLDGFEATRIIRELEAAGELANERPLPVVALTANAVKGDRERCLAAGMDDYVSKPVDPAILRAKLVAHLPAPEGSEPSPNQSPEVAVDSAEDAVETGDPIAPIDIEQLRVRCLGKSDLVERVLRKFVDRLSDDLLDIELAAADGTDEDLRCHAHSLKGGAANVAAVELAERASILEAAARRGDLDAARAAVTSVSMAATRCRDHIAALLDGSSLSVEHNLQVPQPELAQ